MTKELLDLVNEFRSDGIIITDEEAEDVYSMCLKKMEISRIQDRETYLPILFRSELRNYLFRRMVNATTMLKSLGTEVAYV